MKAFLCWVQVNWPDINFVDPSPPPRGRKKAAGFFDEYVPDSDEDAEDQAVRRNIAEGFYRQPSRSTRSSAAVIPNGSGSRNPSSSSASVDLETLEEEGLSAREKARKARHEARDNAKVKVLVIG